jgi:hypothetical protein
MSFSSPSARNFSPGDIFDGYRLQKAVANGAFSSVYEAIQI